MSYAAVLDSRESGINEALARKGAGFGVHRTSSFKNNGVMQDGFCLDTGRSISPVIYPPKEWIQNATDEEIADRLIDIDADADENTKNINLQAALEADYILSHVKPRLYGLSNREDMDKLERSYTEFLDLLVGYYIEISEMTNDDGVSSISLTTPLIEQTGLSLDEVHTAALANLNDDYSIRNLSDIIGEFLGLDEVDKDLETPELMIITNSKGVYGAACILSERVQQELTEILGSSSWVCLPSSIHETIVTPLSLASDISELLEMVTSINADVVQPVDRLTDSVYLYKNGAIQKVA